MSSTPKFRRDASAASELRAPPHSIEAEQAVLGGLMLDRAAWDNVGDVEPAIEAYAVRPIGVEEQVRRAVAA